MNEKLIRLPEVMEMTGLKKSAIYDFIKQGSFPANIPIGARARAWRESEIQNWISERIQEAAA